MRWQLRVALAANQAPPHFIARILEQVRKMVASTEELLVLSEEHKSEQQLEAWAAQRLKLEDLDNTRLAKAIISLRKPQAAVRQTASGAVPSGT